MSSESNSGGEGRAAAYAELITAVLDLRSSTPTRTFDQAVAQAVADGRLAPDLARELKWLQRQTLRELVDHAEHVLPATIVSLEEALGSAPVTEADQGDPDVENPDVENPAADNPAAPESTTQPRPPPTPVSSPPEQPTHPSVVQQPAPAPMDAPPPVDLTARRMLVAGLRTIEDRSFP